MSVNKQNVNPVERVLSEEEIEELIRRVFEVELTTDEFAQLQLCLRTNPKALRAYADYACVHTLLSQLQSSESEVPIFCDSDSLQIAYERDSVSTSAAKKATTAIQHEPNNRLRTPHALFWSRTVPLSLVILIAAIGGLAFNFRPTQPAAVAWKLPLQKNEPQQPIKPGELVLGEEVPLVLQFENGVLLNLSPHGELEVLSHGSVRLISGQVYVDIGENGHGFTVLTDATNVVDLGTVFGVGITDQGETDVLVFDGEVEFEHSSATTSHAVASQSLRAGEGLRIQINGAQDRISQIWRDPVASSWSTGDNLKVQSAVESVRDNLSTESRPKFYAVLPGGFVEDCPAYVDRKYEWNGLTPSGFPPEMLGGDCICTFNDDKMHEDIEIIVTLNSDADFFVLVDQRYPVPEWLSRDFVKTQHQIGIDLGQEVGSGFEPIPPLGTDTTRYLGNGPGQSIDVPVTVWRREVRGSREVRLGSLPAYALPYMRGSMYGCVVRSVPTPK